MGHPDPAVPATDPAADPVAPETDPADGPVAPATGPSAGTTTPAGWYRTYLIVLGVGVALALAIRSIPVIIDRLPGSLSFYLLIVLAIVADTPFFTLVAPAGAARREWPAVVSASVCFTFAISVNWSGVGGATLVQVVAVLVAAALFRRPLARTVFDAGRYGLAMFAAGGVFVAAHHPVGIANDPHTDGLIVAGALAWFGVFHLLTAVEERLRAGTGWWPALCRHAGEEALSAAAMLMLGVMVVGLVRGDGWLLVFTLVPLFAVGRMIRLEPVGGSV